MIDPPPGYRLHPFHDPFEDYVGPLWLDDRGGDLRFAFRAQPKHCNTGGSVHGGMLMTFADFALCFAGCWDTIEEERCVTISLDCEFLDGARDGDLIEASAEVLRQTRRLSFVRGIVTVGDRNVLSFAGVARRFERRDDSRARPGSA